MVRLFCTEMQLEKSSHETLISVFTRSEGTSFVINIKDLKLEKSQLNDDAQRLLAEEIQEAVARFYEKSTSNRLIAV